MQLTANIHTREIVLLNDENSPIHSTLLKLNIYWNEEITEYERAVNIYEKCRNKLNAMRKEDKLMKENPDKLTRVCKFLLENRSVENDDGLRYLLHSENRVEDGG